MKFFRKIFGLVSVFILCFVSLSAPLVHAYAFNPNSIINDSVFSNSTSMNAGQIDNWLNASFGSTSCISTSHGFGAPDPTGYSASTGQFSYSGNVSAGQVIYDAARTYGINPQVLLATLQKEQSLVTGGSGCTILGDTGAMGYGCPDSGTTHSYPAEGALAAPLFYLNGSPITSVSGTCVNTAAKAGFSQQVIHGAWLLKFGQQRSLGNTGWDVQLSNAPEPGDSWDNSDDPQTCYGGPMTQGMLSRGCGQAAASYDGYTIIDGSSIHMNTGATAALYWYTPHLSGNQNFDNIFASWFGDPNSTCVASTNVSGAPSGPKIVAYQYSHGGPTSLAYTQQNNTGSACVEVHVWNSGFQSWATHIATGMRATNPNNGTIVFNNAAGNFINSLSNPAYITYSGGGGRAEVHMFSPNLQIMPGYYDVATNLSGVSSASGQFVVGDFFGRHFDQMAYVLYNGSTGHVEVHMFETSLQSAIGYYDVATNLAGVSSATGTFVAGDFLGMGHDQLAYVLYNGSSGKVEVHMFDPSLQKAIGYYDVATNLAGFDPSQ